MSHSRRYFESNKTYTVTFRTREGLPFVATYYMELLLAGIVARTQRDHKVTLCHDLWMGNHVHLIIFARDPQQLANFYAEIQKKVTDTLKALLGKDRLCLWEGRPVVAQVLDVQAAIEQIAYLYANPARASLVESIREYPALNSFKDFSSIEPKLEATTERTAHWVPSSLVPPLPSPVMKKHKDLDFAAELKALAIPHAFIRSPNAWMKSFGVTEEGEIAEINSQIAARIKEKEAQYAESRLTMKISVLGPHALRLRSITTEHTPPKVERRIFVISSDRELRISFIQQFKAICDLCRDLFFDALGAALRLAARSLSASA